MSSLRVNQGGKRHLRRDTHHGYNAGGTIHLRAPITFTGPSKQMRLTMQTRAWAETRNRAEYTHQITIQLVCGLPIPPDWPALVQLNLASQVSRVEAPTIQSIAISVSAGRCGENKSSSLAASSKIVIRSRRDSVKTIKLKINTLPRKQRTIEGVPSEQNKPIQVWLYVWVSALHTIDTVFSFPKLHKPWPL